MFPWRNFYTEQMFVMFVLVRMQMRNYVDT